ncbi:MAG: ATP synthase F1 subunit gamma [Clostridiales bacterium]|nr:ATP synthase F1 subunit gamma [Clostridiales bacterium]
MAGSSMRDIKRRIRSVTSIEHITNAMKLVSAAKLRRTRSVYEHTRGNLHYIMDRIHEFVSVADEIPSRFILGGHEIRRTCYVVVTSNRGLAGSYNTNIIKTAEREKAADAEKGKEEPLFVCVGNKGHAWFSKRGHEILSAYTDPLESISFSAASELMAPMLELYSEGEIDEVVIIYTMFNTTIEQHAVKERLLPFEPMQAKADGSYGLQAGEEPIEGGPYGLQAGQVGQAGQADDLEGSTVRPGQVEYEPSPEAVLAYLVPKYAEIMMYHSIIEAATCEHAARRMAMQNATDNAREMIGSLELSFNRARQAAITSEITEIISGADAIK